MENTQTSSVLVIGAGVLGLAAARELAVRGNQVTLVTCTLGEEGEVLVPDLAHLASTDQDGLGPHRLIELEAAMAELGVTDHLRLGGDGRFRDSGMATDDDGKVIPAESAPEDCFWRTDLLVAADELVPVIRERRPHVIITYNQFGGYGHPDHIQAHRVAMYGAQLAAARAYRPEHGPAWQVPRILWSTWAESTMREGIRRARAAGNDDFFGGMDPDGPLPPMVTPDDLIDVVVDGSAHLDAKVAALRAHATQVNFDDTFWKAMTGDELWGIEHYIQAQGVPFPTGGMVHDLYAGIDLQ
ncbi:MAG: N-acetyl-1-D-myo-inositol-2-amino-2-deoxy-alpha-D-glucopyranoside deacetylase [Propionibacteriales bacterium]|nr:N-acetyl-1-D-myo-inositol-2-amino-2-deoxy-alpha-D-glucopyranoside deacetylase [Propionibacteriales bacterium]